MPPFNLKEQLPDLDQSAHSYEPEDVYAQASV